VFDVEIQDIFIVDKLQPDCVAKRRVPGDAFVVEVYRGLVVVCRRYLVVTDDPSLLRLP
jgi:hypothetical protein